MPGRLTTLVAQAQDSCRGVCVGPWEVWNGCVQMDYAVCRFAPEARAAIAQGLRAKLGRDTLSERRGPGGSVLTYVESRVAINLANVGSRARIRLRALARRHRPPGRASLRRSAGCVWIRQLELRDQERQRGFCACAPLLARHVGLRAGCRARCPQILQDKTGRYECGVTAIVRVSLRRRAPAVRVRDFACCCEQVTLRDNTYHEDVGYGHGLDPSQGRCLEKSKKVCGGGTCGLRCAWMEAHGGGGLAASGLGREETCAQALRGWVGELRVRGRVIRARVGGLGPLDEGSQLLLLRLRRRPAVHRYNKAHVASLKSRPTIAAAAATAAAGAGGGGGSGAGGGGGSAAAPPPARPVVTTVNGAPPVHCCASIESSCPAARVGNWRCRWCWAAAGSGKAASAADTRWATPCCSWRRWRRCGSSPGGDGGSSGSSRCGGGGGGGRAGR